MATLIILCKIASIVLALRFFQTITTVKTEPHFYGLKIAQFKNILKIFFGSILIFGALSLIPFTDIFGNVFKSKNKIDAAKGAKAPVSINKKDLYGTWEIKGFTHTVTYYRDKKVFFKYADHTEEGAWTINQNKLLITLKGVTREYIIDLLTPQNYEITETKTEKTFKATKME